MKNILFFLLVTLTACHVAPNIKTDGGIRIVIEVDSTGLSKEELAAARAESIKILAKRADFFGTDIASLKAGADPQQIVLELAGKKFEMQRLRKVLQSNANLSFCETYDLKELYPKLIALNDLLAGDKDTLPAEAPVAEASPVTDVNVTLEEQLAQQKAEAHRKMDNKENPLFAFLQLALVNGEDNRLQLGSGPVLGYTEVSDTARINNYLQSEEAKKIFGPYVKFLWSYKAVDKAQRSYMLIAIRTKRNAEVALSGDVVKEAKKVFDEPSGGQPQISLTMTPAAAAKWKKLTAQNIGKSIAIVLDGNVFSFPTVQGEISGGVSSITGSFTQEEADDLVSVLNAGYLPARLSIISEEQVLPQK